MTEYIPAGICIVAALGVLIGLPVAILASFGAYGGGGR